ncbi:hypothetical protein ACW5WQ_21385 [Aeromonas rivuli]|jgi:hypothetical protein|uniref:hypothetical protein n=1 Tax=Aeromonas rivuli TaxID=648794 RepID=UPI000AE87B8D|nr:hypothetical protein [Aeromonas rivuli]
MTDQREKRAPRHGGGTFGNGDTVRVKNEVTASVTSQFALLQPGIADSPFNR